MEGVLLEVRHQIIADFYRKNVSKWKTYTVRHLKEMGCRKNAIHHVMQLLDAG